MDKSTLRNLTLLGTFSFKGAKFKIALIPAFTNLFVISWAAVCGTAIIAMSIFSFFTTKAMPLEQIAYLSIYLKVVSFYELYPILGMYAPRGRYKQILIF